QNAAHSKLGVDNSELVHSHFASTNSVPKTRRAKSGKFLDILGARVWPRNKFARAQIVEGVLVSKLTRSFDAAHNGRKIVIRAEVVTINHCGILKIITCQAHRTFARRLHKSRRDCERVRWRIAKARGNLGRNDWQLMKHKTNVYATREPPRQKSFCLDCIAVRRPIRNLAVVLEHDA